ncbi:MULTISPECIES: long chain fatty acid-CoA synthetase Faa4p [unclassified Mycobacterium]|uniref:long chain fatty acid-CoA synthetase Faa4p n=1 Tax=unclassified Mycobacterium TaxID=2642494 RepID=UPI00080032C0|nr:MULTISPECIES: long chain fatty acid-CoA synthetase Faa4p [unclassified Mycobacterium]OBG50269.1 long chain fatty acid-CoA synthetase Faa4p [Mycobacterium sp. E735]OBG67445.1 long chain fatty acid-CoA synthetase Faa4p [Mycobacterium sp. E188]OBG73410.1 long chain fatty acid-CoA synthetase Faa4p [Mycobacterium sp. E3305]OBG76758.1 long chain fatty acid-CoA synthetase Faa4p [Mycobacterium sp. E3298]OBH40962.1 long chain fatty acid-CoA synthetase Faa4p [Mycobacterium sp. E183]
MVGQCFDIEITRDADGWMIRVPEIGRVTRTVRRDMVEPAARECIATWTGIPIGYVAVYVVSENV